MADFYGNLRYETRRRYGKKEVANKTMGFCGFSRYCRKGRYREREEDIVKKVLEYENIIKERYSDDIEKIKICRKNFAVMDQFF